MNYWPRWIRAIRGATLTLSMAQMGAYDRLLDYYYETEQPLPLDDDECCRIAGAASKQDRADVAKVLAKFFARGADGWRQERADEEIASGLHRISQAKANGSKGGRRPGSPNKPKKNPAGLIPVTDPLTGAEPGGQALHPHPQIEEEVPSGTSPSAGELRPSVVVSIALRKFGIQANADHPRLLALCDAGATVGEFIALLPSADRARDPFAYLLGAVEGNRIRAKEAAGQMHRGPLVVVNKQQALEESNRRVADEWLRQQGATS